MTHQNTSINNNDNNNNPPYWTGLVFDQPIANSQNTTVPTALIQDTMGGDQPLEPPAQPLNIMIDNWLHLTNAQTNTSLYAETDAFFAKPEHTKDEINYVLENLTRMIKTLNTTYTFNTANYITVWNFCLNRWLLKDYRFHSIINAMCYQAVPSIIKMTANNLRAKSFELLTTILNKNDVQHRNHQNLRDEVAYVYFSHLPDPEKQMHCKFWLLNTKMISALDWAKNRKIRESTPSLIWTQLVQLTDVDFVYAIEHLKRSQIDLSFIILKLIEVDNFKLFADIFEENNNQTILQELALHCLKGADQETKTKLAFYLLNKIFQIYKFDAIPFGAPPQTAIDLFRSASEYSNITPAHKRLITYLFSLFPKTDHGAMIQAPDSLQNPNPVNSNAEQYQQNIFDVFFAKTALSDIRITEFHNELSSKLFFIKNINIPIKSDLFLVMWNFCAKRCLKLDTRFAKIMLELSERFALIYNADTPTEPNNVLKDETRQLLLEILHRQDIDKSFKAQLIYTLFSHMPEIEKRYHCKRWLLKQIEFPLLDWNENDFLKKTNQSFNLIWQSLAEMTNDQLLKAFNSNQTELIIGNENYKFIEMIGRQAVNYHNFEEPSGIFYKICARKKDLTAFESLILHFISKQDILSKLISLVDNYAASIPIYISNFTFTYESALGFIEYLKTLDKKENSNEVSPDTAAAQNQRLQPLDLLSPELSHERQERLNALLNLNDNGSLNQLLLKMKAEGDTVEKLVSDNFELEFEKLIPVSSFAKVSQAIDTKTITIGQKYVLETQFKNYALALKLLKWTLSRFKLDALLPSRPLCEVAIIQEVFQTLEQKNINVPVYILPHLTFISMISDLDAAKNVRSLHEFLIMELNAQLQKYWLDPVLERECIHYLMESQGYLSIPIAKLSINSKDKLLKPYLQVKKKNNSVALFDLFFNTYVATHQVEPDWAKKGPTIDEKSWCTESNTDKLIAIAPLTLNSVPYIPPSKRLRADEMRNLAYTLHRFKIKKLLSKRTVNLQNDLKPNYDQICQKCPCIFIAQDKTFIHLRLYEGHLNFDQDLKAISKLTSNDVNKFLTDLLGVVPQRSERGGFLLTIEQLEMIETKFRAGLNHSVFPFLLLHQQPAPYDIDKIPEPVNSIEIHEGEEPDLSRKEKSAPQPTDSSKEVNRTQKDPKAAETAPILGKRKENPNSTLQPAAPKKRRLGYRENGSLIEGGITESSIQAPSSKKDSESKKQNELLPLPQNRLKGSITIDNSNASDNFWQEMGLKSLYEVKDRVTQQAKTKNLLTVLTPDAICMPIHKKLAALKDTPRSPLQFINPILKNYQKEILHRIFQLHRINLNPTLAIEMGLGKTYIALELILQSAEGLHLIIVPKSVVSDIADQASKVINEACVHAWKSALSLAKAYNFENLFYDLKSKVLANSPLEDVKALVRIFALLPDSIKKQMDLAADDIWTLHFQRFQTLLKMHLEFLFRGAATEEKKDTLYKKLQDAIKSDLSISWKKAQNSKMPTIHELCEFFTDYLKNNDSRSSLELLGRILCIDLEATLHQLNLNDDVLKSLMQRSLSLYTLSSKKEAASFNSHNLQSSSIIIASIEASQELMPIPNLGKKKEDKSLDSSKVNTSSWKLKLEVMKTLVVDEAQTHHKDNCVNSDWLKLIVKKITVVNPSCRFLPVTGTPMENDAGELWTILDASNPGLLDRTIYNNLLKLAEDAEYVLGKEVTQKSEELLLRSFIYWKLFAEFAHELVIRKKITDEDVKRDWGGLVPERLESKIYTTFESVEDELNAVFKEEEIQPNSADIKKTKFDGMILDFKRQHQVILAHTALNMGQSLGSNDIQKLLPTLLKDVDKTISESPLLNTLFNSAQFKTVINRKKQALILVDLNGIGEFVMAMIKAKYKNVEIQFYNGELDSEERKKMKKWFKDTSSHPKIMVMAIKAGGVGLNLPEAEICFNLMWDFNPFAERQAKGRNFRVGSTGIREYLTIKYKKNGTKLFTQKHTEVVKKRKIALDEFFQSTAESLQWQLKKWGTFLSYAAYHSALNDKKNVQAARDYRNRVEQNFNQITGKYSETELSDMIAKARPTPLADVVIPQLPPLPQNQTLPQSIPLPPPFYAYPLPIPPSTTQAINKVSAENKIMPPRALTQPTSAPSTTTSSTTAPSTAVKRKASQELTQPAKKPALDPTIRKRSDYFSINLTARDDAIALGLGLAFAILDKKNSELSKKKDQLMKIIRDAKPALEESKKELIQHFITLGKEKEKSESYTIRNFEIIDKDTFRAKPTAQLTYVINLLEDEKNFTLLLKK